MSEEAEGMLFDKHESLEYVQELEAKISRLTSRGIEDMLFRIEALEHQLSIYDDHKDVSLTKDLERIAELEAAIIKHRDQLAADKKGCIDEILYRVLEDG